MNIADAHGIAILLVIYVVLALACHYEEITTIRRERRQ